MRRLLSLPKLVIAAALIGSAAVALSTVGALSGFSASITNSQNTVASGSLVMQETSGAITCLSNATSVTNNTATCTTINKFGGSVTMTPGSTPSATTVVITNKGTVTPSSFQLTPAGCTPSNNGTYNGSDSAGFCGKIDLTIQQTGATSCVFPASSTAVCPATPTSAGTLTSLGTTALTLPNLAGGASATYVFTVMLDSTATNADQGLLASVPLTWSFSV